MRERTINNPCQYTVDPLVSIVHVCILSESGLRNLLCSIIFHHSIQAAKCPSSQATYPVNKHSNSTPLISGLSRQRNHWPFHFFAGTLSTRFGPQAGMSKDARYLGSLPTRAGGAPQSFPK